MSETAAAHLNFGPAWLRDTLTSEAASSSGFNLPQPLSKSSSMPSGYMAFPSSSGLATAKLAEFRYGREEMLALYHSDLLPPLPCQMSALASAAILVERPQLPLNLSGVSEDEQRAWQRGANSESSLKLYKKDSGGMHHAPGMGRGVSTDRIGRGAGRGVGGPRGGPAGVGGNSFFDRHRGIEDDGLDSVGGGVPIGGGAGRGRGVEEGGRSFGRGSSRGFERSISERGGWFERSNSTSDPNEANGGNISPRKGYTRAPFDDWRKPPSGYQDGEEEGGPSWRGANTASGRRWNAPHGAERGGGNVPPVVGEGRGAAWRNAAPGSEEYRRYGGDREFINGARDEFSERGGRRGGGGYHNSSMSKYGRRPRQDSDNLPEWAADESSPLENRGGSFDSAGKFQAVSNADSNNRRHPSTQSQSQRDDLDDENEDDWGEREDGTPPKNRQQQRENHHKIAELAHEDEEESHFEDEEVDVDDLPSELKRDTLEQREREKASKSSARIDEKEKDIRAEDSSSAQQQQQQQQPAAEDVSDDKVSGNRPAEEQQQQPVHWIYLDPQGNTQGPFNATDMLDWFNAGYFPQDLMLRRTVDRRFIQLGEMTKRYGRIPFFPGVNAPAPLPEVEPLPPVPQPPQLSVEQEEKQRQQQQANLYLKINQQLMLSQQVMQQQQFLAIQQQQQGASPQALAQAAQQMAEHQKQHQQLLAQLMQLTLLQQQQHHPQQQLGGVLQQQQQAKEFSASPSPLDYVSMSSPSPLDLLQQRVHQQQQHANVTAPFELPKQGEQRPHPQPQQGGLDFAQSFVNTGSGSGYDPIKSLLSQLQENTPHDYPNQSSSPASSLFGNSAGSGSTFSGFGGIPGQQQGSRPGSVHQVPPVANEFNDQIPASHSRSIWDLPVSNLREEEPSPEPKVPNVWMNEGSVSPVNLFSSRQQKQQQPDPEPQHHQHKAQLQQQQQQQQLQQQFYHQQQLQQQEDDEVLSNGVNENYDNDREEVGEGDEFLKPKANEKKDKKVKRAEEKRRQKEAKRVAAAAEAAQADYIPGQGRPQADRNVNQSEEVAREDWGDDGDDAQGRHTAQMEALQRLQEEQRRALEREAQARQQQQQVKLAPWAKRTQHDSGSRDLSLAEIQKLEEEREREARIRREIEEQEMRARQEAEAEQMRRQASKSHNWASAASSNGNHGSSHASAATKSLAEIQAEEERQERERLERERKERKARQKEMGLAQACVWGSATSNLSWASRTATANPPAAAPVANQNNQKGQKQQQQQQEMPAWKQQQQGFWDEPTPQQQQQQQNKNVQKQQQQQQQQQQQKGGNRSKKGVKEETKVAAIFRDKQKPQNEFESWCGVSLEKLNAEVDIPTFMAFLNDIESPFEVHDYIRNYIGEAKAHKNFAKEYLERRSQWKNSMKARRNFEDDLLTPAAAINPNDPDFLDGPLGGNGASPGGSKSASNRSKKKGGKSKAKDVSHLLAFSVAPSERVNAGELDLPN